MPIFCVTFGTVLLGLPATEPAAWTPTRTTSPASLAELRALQARVTSVVDRVTPATVGLLTEGNRTGMLGAGSGVIVRDTGLILTAAHVIQRPGEMVRVVLSDGTVVAGKTLGVNPIVDSGMVQITGKVPAGSDWPGADDGKWPFAEVGSSKDLKSGQWLVALGHPGGPKKDRKPPVRVGRMIDYFVKESAVRTDCALVGGDSGGPLFDLAGKVVGIHSRIGSLQDHNMHVATEFFRDEWDQLVRGLITDLTGKAEIGITLMESREAPTVRSVNAGGPAEDAGFLPGDVILSFDGERVHSADDLRHLLLKAVPTVEVEVEVRRGDAKKTLTVTLGRKADH
jgi:serine protease Do